jgi:hypothetical protein
VNYDAARHPPSILLDYVYGAAALRRWNDTGYKEFTTRTGLKRFQPSLPVLDPPHQQRTDEDRQHSADKRSQALEAFSPGDSTVDNNALTVDQADEIMMYFLLRTPRAIRLQQRLLEEEREKDQRTKDWVAERRATHPGRA